MFAIAESGEALLDAIFRDLRDDEWIELRLIAKEHAQQLFFKQPAELLAKVAEVSGTVNCFFGVAPRKERSGTKESVSRVTALWTDVDAKAFGGSKALACEAIYGLVLPPSFVVDSGHGYHGYWLLEEACTAREAESALQRIREITGGDLVCDSSRVLRVPGSLNIKAEPCPCKLLRTRPDLRFRLSDIEAATRVSRDTAQHVLTAARGSHRSRSERDWHVVMELSRLGMSREAIKLVFSEQPIGDKYREKGGEKYLDHTLANAAERVGISGEGLPAGSSFFEQGDSWWIVSSKGRRQVSTFVFEPRRVLELPLPHGDTLFGVVRSDGFRWDDVPFPRTAFARVDSMLRALPIASWQWLGTDSDARHLLPYLIVKWKELGRPKAIGVTTVGRHKEHWVWERGSMTVDEIFDNYTSPIVFVPSFRARPRTQYLLVEPSDEFLATMRRVSELLPKINRPGAIWPILGWFMATPLKPVFEELQIRFPLLDLYGTRGSGKSSTVLQVMLPLLGIVEPHAYDCSTTPFVLLSLLASTNAIPVSLGEFRESSLTKRAYETLRRAMLLSYDVGFDARGRPDQTTVEYPLCAPFSVDGEDAIADSAILERTVMVNLHPEDIVEGSSAWVAFLELIELPLWQFAGHYIRHTLRYDTTTLWKLWEEALGEIRAAFPRILSERVRRNLTVVLCGIKLYTSFMERLGAEARSVPASILGASLEEVSKEALGRTLTSTDALVVDLVNEVAAARHDPLPFIVSYDQAENVLWFHLSSVIKWWQVERRRAGLDILAEGSIQVQLKERVQDFTERPGQYIRGPKSVTVGGSARLMYGLDLTAAYNCGLDIPDRITTRLVTLTFTGGGGNAEQLTE